MPWTYKQKPPCEHVKRPRSPEQEGALPGSIWKCDDCPKSFRYKGKEYNERDGWYQDWEEVVVPALPYTINTARDTTTWYKPVFGEDYGT